MTEQRPVIGRQGARPKGVARRREILDRAIDVFRERGSHGTSLRRIAESLGMERPAGALVSSVAANGPAARAGLKPGDVVMTMNGKLIEHVDALGYRLATQPIGAVIVHERVAKHFDERVLACGLTYYAHPTGCAAALRTRTEPAQAAAACFAAASLIAFARSVFSQEKEPSRPGLRPKWP